MNQLKTLREFISILCIAVVLVYLPLEMLCYAENTVDIKSPKNPLSVSFQGDYIEFHQPPMVVNGRLLLPIHEVCEKIGARVTWEPKTGITTITKDYLIVRLQIGSKEIKISRRFDDAPMGTKQLEVAPKVYNGSVLLPLRPILETFDYVVNWSKVNNEVILGEGIALKIEGVGMTEYCGIQSRVPISTLQQFRYKDMGLAFAYLDGEKLVIHTPEKKLSFFAEYMLLGDVISDNEGNFYVIWGEKNESATPKETVFITKYSPKGRLIKTTGFEGVSSPWKSSDLAKTQVPFLMGYCVSAIADHKLINYHTKQRYDGSSSDQVIGVNIDTMEPIQLEKTTFTGTSVNQSLIYHKATSNFLFVSQGSFAPRGFKVNTLTGGYGLQQDVLFHVNYLPHPRNQQYYITDTYAQLGDIAETSKGVALVGASVKSIGEDAKSQHQNLFIQMLDPMKRTDDLEKYLGGESRSGITYSYDDSINLLRKSTVKDRGVRWLTNYQDKDVVAPQVVIAEDRIVILWGVVYDDENDVTSFSFENFYMILNSSGEIVQEATSLGWTSLNSFERPIYHEGSIYWVSAQCGEIRMRELRLPK